MERIYLVRVPVPFELEFVNLYLIEGDSGLTLIDCGPKTKDTYEHLNNYLQSIHRGFRDIKNVTISHYHVDHYGFSGELRKLSDVSIIMHEMEVPLVDSYDSTFTFWVDEGLRYGMPPGLVKDIKKLYELVPGMISHARVDEILIHHEERLKHVLDVMGNGYETAYDISLRMKWIGDTILGNDLPDSEKPLALVEAVIHLELLSKRGRVARIYKDSHIFFKKA